MDWWRQVDPSFAQAYADAMEAGTDAIEQEPRRRAVDGYDRPVYLPRAEGMGLQFLHVQSFHFIEQPAEGCCSAGPCPVSAISFIASYRSRRALATGVVREASSRPRYCNSPPALILAGMDHASYSGAETVCLERRTVATPARGRSRYHSRLSEVGVAENSDAVSS
jgi:hypothetical protein